MKRKKMPRNSAGAGIFLSACLLVSCGFFLSGMRGWAQDAYRIETYHYNPAGKIDPFKPLVKPEIPKKSGHVTPVTPLQQYDISQLKLVGIAGNGTKKVAMVTDKKGRSYVLSPGTLIGPNRGRVAQILDDQIIVEERVDDSKKPKINRLTLKLHRYEEKP
jgi:Tfp pilus assembly protein PilP